MKQAIFCLLALGLGLSGAAQAQHCGRGGNVSLGLKAGASLTRFTGQDISNSDYGFGFHAGGFANIGLTTLIAFQSELLYSQKGDRFIINKEEHRTRLHYIEAPLAFHVNTNGFFFEAGPQVGVLVAAQGEAGSFSVDTKERFKTVGVGYLVGLGYQLKQGPGVGLRYNGEFTEFLKPITIGNATQQGQARNSAFQLYATYSFN